MNEANVPFQPSIEPVNPGTRYARELTSALSGWVAVDPEAQLTVPISNLFRAVADSASLGRLELLREARLDGVRPDFAALIDGRPCGWVELKAPGHSLDGERWRGRERRQWELLSALDSLIVTDGYAARLYNAGTMVNEYELPTSGAAAWPNTGLVALLRQFLSSTPRTVRRVKDLAERLAPLTALLRDRLLDGHKGGEGEVREAHAAWKASVHDAADPAVFASDVAQVIAYSMAIVGLGGGGDADQDSLITLHEARDELRKGPSNVLAAALGPIIGIPELLKYVAPELGGIERLVSAIDASAVHRSRDSRGEAWLWFYEDFLAKYDPKARSEAGVYYTPTSVVQCQVRMVDNILRRRLDRNLGFGAPSVVTLDPATGSGTYPLAVIDRAAAVAAEDRGPAGVAQVGRNLTRNLVAFELLPGPYAVAHLRIGQRLAETSSYIGQFEPVRVYLTDTLEDPSVPAQKGLWGDARILADQASSARKVKHGEKVTVLIGNPPYDRVPARTGGGWVVHPMQGRALFADVLEPAQRAGVKFSEQASVYNSYVYFWRWAIWKAFQEHPDESAVVSFITASSWIRGPVFQGLRDMALKLCDEIWVVDLGGEALGARPEDNVFAISTPVAIVTMFRRGSGTSGSATVRYTRIRGTRSEKFATLDAIDGYRRGDSTWVTVDTGLHQPFAPPSGAADWQEMPALIDIFPWQQPGMMYSRSWPVSPSPDVLRRRWRELLRSEDAALRAELFITPSTGRNIYTQVGGRPTLASLPIDAPAPALSRVGWRSFDRQWTLNDPRLISLERPLLWASSSSKQLFFSTMTRSALGAGPAMTVTIHVPDKHHFRGSYGGKDVIPLYRDRSARNANVTHGLLELLSTTFGQRVSVEDIAAYVFSLMAQPGYAELFTAELETPGPRVPLTKSASLFGQGVAIGRELIWLQSFGERMVDPAARPYGVVPRITGIGWRTEATRVPRDRSDWEYDAIGNELIVADGVVTGVRPDVWNFQVSGMKVLEKWLGYRTRHGIGKSTLTSASVLDRIRPESWEDEWNDELLDIVRVLTASRDRVVLQRELLELVIQGPMFLATELPVPTKGERADPTSD